MSSKLAENDSESDAQENPLKTNKLLGQVRKKLIQILKTPNKSGLQESIEEILEKNGSDNNEALDAGEKAILKNVLDFKELHVEDIMIPRVDIFAIPEDIEFDELQKKLFDKTYTRIPVYKGDLDEILGFIHIKDIARVFFKNKSFSVKEILRKCLFVPSSMKISNLLIRMQQAKVHIAIVIDEYGGTEGIVSLEDIMEEIVGNIEDEHDEDDLNTFRKISDDIYEVSSRMSMEEFFAKSGIDLSIKEAEKEFDTVGGLVTYLLGRIPVKGEVISYNDNIELEVTEADARQVRRLVVKKKS